MYATHVMQGVSSSEDLLLKHSLQANLCAFTLAVGSRGENLMDNASSVFVEEEAILVVCSKKPVTKPQKLRIPGIFAVEVDTITSCTFFAWF